MMMMVMTTKLHFFMQIGPKKAPKDQKTFTFHLANVSPVQCLGWLCQGWFKTQKCTTILLQKYPKGHFFRAVPQKLLIFKGIDMYMIPMSFLKPLVGEILDLGPPQRGEIRHNRYNRRWWKCLALLWLIMIMISHTWLKPISMTREVASNGTEKYPVWRNYKNILLLSSSGKVIGANTL